MNYNFNTFSTQAGFSKTSVDMKMSNASGFQWYCWNFFGNLQTCSSVALHANGYVTLSGGTGTENGSLATAAYTAAAPYYVGTAFGGGAYIEAEIAFDSNKVNVQTGWPSWWTLSLEHLVGLPGEHWAGQTPRYAHYIEADAFEYNRPQLGGNVYGGALRDWFGIYNTTCQAYCNVTTGFEDSSRAASTRTDWSNFHRAGMLWVPATKTELGSISFWLDGKRLGRPTNYQRFTNQMPPVTRSMPWTFGVIDQQHLVLILGTGASTPMEVKSVNVWQASDTDNLAH